MIDLKKTLNSLERSIIVDSLKKHKGHVTQTAEFLSLNRTTLVMKMKKYGIPINIPTKGYRSSLKRAEIISDFNERLHKFSSMYR